MLLRNSISKTKQFFHKTIQSFKSILSGGYQKLPKTPTFNPFSCGGGDTKMLDNNFYTDFTNQWEFEQSKVKKRNKKKTMEPMEEGDAYNESFMKFARENSVNGRRQERREDAKITVSVHEGESCSHESMRDGRGHLMTQKLKELEMMDQSNVDHVLDIEEILHYYSLLTCPVYVDILNKFVMEMYSEIFLSGTSARG